MSKKRSFKDNLRYQDRKRLYRLGVERNALCFSRENGKLRQKAPASENEMRALEENFKEFEKILTGVTRDTLETLILDVTEQVCTLSKRTFVNKAVASYPLKKRQCSSPGQYAPRSAV